jgi:hypothetical protein
VNNTNIPFLSSFFSPFSFLLTCKIVHTLLRTRTCEFIIHFTLSHSLQLPRALTHTLSRTHSLTLAHSHTHTLAHSLTHSRALTRSLLRNFTINSSTSNAYPSHQHARAHTHTTHAHVHEHTRTHNTRARTHTHTHTQHMCMRMCTNAGEEVPSTFQRLDQLEPSQR